MKAGRKRNLSQMQKTLRSDLREIRTMLGVTQEQLAKKAGLSADALRKFEKGDAARTPVILTYLNEIKAYLRAQQSSANAAE